MKAPDKYAQLQSDYKHVFIDRCHEGFVPCTQQFKYLADQGDMHPLFVQ